MSATPAPRLTFVLLTQDGFTSIRRTVSAVASQPEAADIELLLVAPENVAVAVDEDLARCFQAVRVIRADFSTGGGVARAAAVHAAAAPVVAFGEDHCFPQTGWAGALLEAHGDDWAAVGPVVENANPVTLVSWADLLMGYGPWLAPGESGEREHLPGHNTSYKRAALLSPGTDLAERLEAETPLQWQLRASGHRLYQEARARVAHTNFERWGTWLVVSFHAGRVFAATRALSWSRTRRLLFALATPLVPFVRLRRHLTQAMRARWPRGLVVRVAPTLLVGLVVDAAGQCLGSLTGAGASRATLVDWEFRRNEPRSLRAAGAR